MKKTNSFIILLIFTIIFLVVPTIYITYPGINNVKESNLIQKISEEEKSKLKQDINNDYQTDIDALEEKYKNLRADIVLKYDNKETEIKKRYDDLINYLDTKYKKQMGEEGWYEEQTKKSSEKSDYTMEEYDKIRTNDEEERLEIKALEERKIREKDVLTETKENEIDKLKYLNNSKELIKAKGIKQILIGIIIVLIYFIIIFGMYNKLVKNKNKVSEKWSKIEVLLKRRNDLIPNLVEVTKGYANHERETLIEVVNKRNNSNNLSDIAKKSEETTRSVKKLLAISESYPDLKANELFNNLQIELTGTEDKIAFARQFYNDCVQRYNTSIMIFPNNIFAKILKYDKKEYFKVSNSDKELVKVKL